MFDAQSPQESFRLILLTVVGQAYGAAGYELEDRPVQWAGGLFRFYKQFDDASYGFIEYQLLAYVDTEWAARMPSRFRVMLLRADNPGAESPVIRRDLSALVVQDFGVPILPSANHWWHFRDTQALGQALAEAGHLVVGYGVPYLAGDLQPPGADSEMPNDGRS